MVDSPYDAWANTPEAAAEHHKTNLVDGLTLKQVETARTKYGFNELDPEKKKPLWELVLEQFNDHLVRILLLAAMVSFALAYFEGSDGEEGMRAYVEPVVILLILVLNAIVGVWQESNAERALDALKDMQSDTAKVFRQGTFVSELAARELVPGDVIQLAEGDKVPADARVIALKSLTLQIDQALLTGESEVVNKQLPALTKSDVPINAKTNMLFAGTSVKKGSCLALVNTIGMHTEIGNIHADIMKAKEEDNDTPLKKKLDEFGELLSQVIGVICLLVWLINIKFFLEVTWEGWMPVSFVFNFAKCTYYFKIAVALAVAAIPEGLPAVITTCLALGTRKMAKKNAIVRKLPSVETLGCTTVICSDKTGTLTTNQMSVVEVVTPASSKDIRALHVEGSTYNPKHGGVQQCPSPLDASLLEFARVATLCNDCQVEEKDGQFKAVGQPTEAALRVVADKLMGNHLSSDPTHAATKHFSPMFKKEAVLEFDRDRKRMSVICSEEGEPKLSASKYSTRSSSAKPASNNMLVVKGQAQSVLSMCNSMLLPSGEVVAFSPSAKAKVDEKVEEMAGNALRCLAMAYKPAAKMGIYSTYNGPDHPAHAALTEPSTYSKVESDLTFVGIAGLMDPPRPEVASAIRECRTAGMRVMMITGDYRATAEAICRKIGIFPETQDSLEGLSIAGQEFMQMDEEAQRQMLAGHGGRCFSGAQPNHKQAIVKRLKEMGEIVAMTGDGVNDAPALQLADIGVAMGIAGTEVAKEASDMVLADDNFSSIVAAVEEGRSIYNNMKAFIRYMISSNFGEVASIFITAATGMPEGLIPVQLLWVNLVTDGPPATALGFNKAEPDIMQRPPRSASDPLISGWVFFRYMVVGIYVGFATVAGFALWYTRDEFMGIDLSKDGHTVISMTQLTSWHHCHEWKDFKPAPFTAGDLTFDFSKDPCSYFEEGKAKASTLSLSVLVAIEMFNAVNALSEDASLLEISPFSNPYLLVAMFVSFGLHFVILYVPFLASTFGIVPLSVEEWKLVILLAFPVILIDEVLKFFGRMRNRAAAAALKKQS
mmetsp:Transcript_13202/g.25228  ORF Transcript_13202/g.25228 Transcript_13202/m.25228 type:complete len:1055 (+) Transcript_13202:56-3220(+)|eukprot:CAMPEP_0114248782 /NCGR_PEP_ID=MMETSP0058-20121206/13767_1 /TAXON_ID=36894 /ORGANISM="Pyramimonas parkeae, CCMP726" /LENGTH=1054 /DNA_ID=CAMNT_0001362233 /DNA_START=56 /DNA_END=3220 /DNA_ORIENTATION=+